MTALIPAGDERITVRVLGGLRSSRSGSPIPLGGDAEALLAHLALTGKPVDGQTAVAALWPGPAGLGHLRTAASELRTALGPEALSAARGGLELHPHQVWCDLDAFLVCAQSGLAMRNGRRTESAPLLRSAAALYAGPVLEGTPYVHARWAQESIREAAVLFDRIANALDVRPHEPTPPRRRFATRRGTVNVASS